MKNTATLIREIAKHTPELCQLIMNAGGIGAVIDYIGKFWTKTFGWFSMDSGLIILFLGETKGTIRLPGIMMLGYVAAHSETLAMAVIMSKGKAHILYRNHTVWTILYDTQ